jgi:hypothetical protein
MPVRRWHRQRCSGAPTLALQVAQPGGRRAGRGGRLPVHNRCLSRPRNAAARQENPEREQTPSARLAARHLHHSFTGRAWAIAQERRSGPSLRTGVDQRPRARARAARLCFVSRRWRGHLGDRAAAPDSRILRRLRLWCGHWHRAWCRRGTGWLHSGVFLCAAVRPRSGAAHVSGKTQAFRQFRPGRSRCR